MDACCKEVIEKSEWIAIATVGAKGPHVVGTWADYMTAFGIDTETLLIPAGLMHQTEANLRHDDRVELLCGTRQVEGKLGPGKGCAIRGRGKLQHTGDAFETVKAQFPWARAALVVKIEQVTPQL